MLDTRSVTMEKLRRRKGTRCQAGHVDQVRLGRLCLRLRTAFRFKFRELEYHLKIRLWGTARRPCDHLMRCNVEQKALACISERFTVHGLYLYSFLKPFQNASSGSGEALPVVG